MNSKSRDIFGNQFDRRTLFYDVIQEWIRTNRMISKSWMTISAPWGHNERASLSVFAGAIWRCGHIAYEEFADEKRRIYQLQRTNYAGRCDIYFEIKRQGYVAEAKQGWSGGTTSHDVVPRIQKTLRFAHQSASRMAATGNEFRRLAIAFIVPMFGKAYARNPDEMINRWTSQIQTISGWEKAWVFPDTSRHYKDLENKYYPGVAIFVRRVKRSLKEH